MDITYGKSMTGLVGGKKEGTCCLQCLPLKEHCLQRIQPATFYLSYYHEEWNIHILIDFV